MQFPRSAIGRLGVLVYGLGSYAVFLLTVMYAVGFVGNLWQAFGWTGPAFRSMDAGGALEPAGRALAIDAMLLGLFAVQHSVMARESFKRRWTRVLPQALERSTFVLAASLCLILLFWQWRPAGTTVLWEARGAAAAALVVASLVGWIVVVLATFMLDHSALFGLRQVFAAYRGHALEEPAFSTPALYKAVRHPIYLGFLIAFWATPTMTLGHLVFAAVTTGYVLVGVQLEERDLVRRFGDEYVEYRRRVWMLLPFPRRVPPAAARSTAKTAS